MPTLKLSKLGEARLRKLIAHLRKPSTRYRFNFDFVRLARDAESEGQLLATEVPCGAVGCAIGHTPAVFPKLVRSARFLDDLHTAATGFKVSARLKRKRVPAQTRNFGQVASLLFGLPNIIARNLFLPTAQYRVHANLRVCKVDATAYEVAYMLEQFISLTKDKQIKY